MVEGIEISQEDADKQIVPEDLNSLAVGSYIVPSPKRRKTYGMMLIFTALISQIIEDSPAQKSGLKEEDVILFFDGEEIFYSSDLPLTVGAIRPDSEVNAMVLRDGKKKTIKVTVGELPKDPAVAFNQTQQNILGIVVENQTTEEQSSYIEGVLVTNLDPEGVAYKSGIRRGDIIYSLARIKIKNVNEFRDVLSELDTERRTTIGVARNGNKRILSLNLSK